MTEPAEPITPTAEAMASLREVYVSMLAAGFSTMEACLILGTMLAQGAGGKRGDE